MKKILIAFAALVMLLMPACSGLDVSGIFGDGNSQKQESKYIAIYLADKDHDVVYPASCGTPTVLTFRVHHEGDYKCDVEAPGATPEVTVEGDAVKVSLLAKETLGSYLNVKVTVSYEKGGSDYYTTSIEKAVLKLNDGETGKVAFEQKGGEQTVWFTTNLSGLRVEDTAEWLSYSAGNAGIRFSTRRNDEDDDRYATVNLTDGVMKLELKVSQVGASEVKRLEREALKALYYALDGDKWNRKMSGDQSLSYDNWLDGPLKKCAGIHTDIFGYISYVNIEEAYNAKGSLPEELKYLTHCQYFHIQNNKGITGGMENIAKMPVLTEFWAYDCGFEQRFDDLGTEEFIAKVRQIKEIQLDKNNLTGPLPAWFIKNLRDNASFDISFNRLEGEIPYELWSLPVFQKYTSPIWLTQQEGYVLYKGPAPEDAEETE